MVSAAPRNMNATCSRLIHGLALPFALQLAGKQIPAMRKCEIMTYMVRSGENWKKPNMFRRPSREKAALIQWLNPACELRDNRAAGAFRFQTACYATIPG